MTAALRAGACIAVFAALTTFALAPAWADDPSAQLAVHGTVLVVENGYLVFTTGDAVRLAPGVATGGLTLGRLVRVVLDPNTHFVTAIEPDSGLGQPGDIDAAALPRAYVVADPRAAQPAPSERAERARSGTVTVTIDVHVPDDTPPSDDIYLATDRSGFNAAELRLNRVDAHRWTVALQLPAGSTLHYLFTRGSYATVERTRGGGIAAAHTLTAAGSVTVDDAVARWADTT